MISQGGEPWGSGQNGDEMFWCEMIVEIGGRQSKAHLNHVRGRDPIAVVSRWAQLELYEEAELPNAPQKIWAT